MAGWVEDVRECGHAGTGRERIRARQARVASVALAPGRPRGSRGSLALACAWLAACAAPPAVPLPAAPTPAGTAPAVSAVPVTGFGYHNETSIAINPTRPLNVIATFQVPVTAAASEDGGRSWRAQALPGTDGFELSGDPDVLVDADGHAYAIYIAFVRPEDYDTLGRAAHRNGIFANRSDDGGHSWGPQVPVMAQPERRGIPFEDKPMAAVDRSSDPARRGHLYVAWTEFRRWQTVILFSRSVDGGHSFSPPVEISDRPGSPKDTVGADEGTSLAVAPDGTIYVVWSDSTGIRLDRSRDGGLTWGRDILVARTPDIVFKVVGVARTNGYPSLALDPRDGRLFVQWVDRRYGGATVLLSSSSDGGSSWSEPVIASDNGPAAADAARDRRDRFFAWMGLDPRSGALVLGYYRVESPGTLRYMLSYSTDRGRTFRHRPWSPDSFPSADEFLGDYTGVDFLDGIAYAAWTEGGSERGASVHALERGTRVVVGKATIP